MLLPPRLMLMILAPLSAHICAAAIRFEARVCGTHSPALSKILTMNRSTSPGLTPMTPKSLSTAVIVPATCVPCP